MMERRFPDRYGRNPERFNETKEIIDVAKLLMGMNPSDFDRVKDFVVESRKRDRGVTQPQEEE